jgi:predicted MFS family arabinose efflux permease
MYSRPERRNILILAVCQALFQSSSIVVMMLSGVVGAVLTSDKSLATLPVAASILGTAAAVMPASLLMKRLGRRSGFLLGAVVGASGGAISAYAIWLQSFWLFCAGNLLIGMYHAFAQYYRFAAIDISSSAFRSRAISLVLGGGLIAALLGPEIAMWSKDLFGSASYYGAYLALMALSLLAALLLYIINLPSSTAAELQRPCRPLRTIAYQPAFVVAIMGAVAAYGVMNLIMVATPLAMEASGHSPSETAMVFRWHMVGMFAPSFVTGALIARFGVSTIMLTGVALLLSGVGVVASGEELVHFFAALALVGTGWNFLYVGATALLTECHDLAEKAKVQGTNELLVFGSSALASFTVGPLLSYLSWEAVGYVALLPLLVVGAALLWLAVRQRAHRGLVQVSESGRQP